MRYKRRTSRKWSSGWIWNRHRSIRRGRFSGEIQDVDARLPEVNREKHLRNGFALFCNLIS